MYFYNSHEHHGRLNHAEQEVKLLQVLVVVVVVMLLLVVVVVMMMAVVSVAALVILIQVSCGAHINIMYIIMLYFCNLHAYATLFVSIYLLFYYMLCPNHLNWLWIQL